MNNMKMTRHKTNNKINEIRKWVPKPDWKPAKVTGVSNTESTVYLNGNIATSVDATIEHPVRNGIVGSNMTETSFTLSTIVRQIHNYYSTNTRNMQQRATASRATVRTLPSRSQGENSNQTNWYLFNVLVQCVRQLSNTFMLKSFNAKLNMQCSRKNVEIVLEICLNYHIFLCKNRHWADSAWAFILSTFAAIL